MLSSGVKSERTIEVNIAIMRDFVQMRQLLISNEEFARKLSELEKRLLKHDEQFQVVFEAIRQLLEEDETPKRKIGFLRYYVKQFCQLKQFERAHNEILRT